MEQYVGVSQDQTSICVVDGNGRVLWQGKSRLDPGYDVYSDEVGHCSDVMSANSDPKLAIVPIGYRPGPAADQVDCAHLMGRRCGQAFVEPELHRSPGLHGGRVTDGAHFGSTSSRWAAPEFCLHKEPLSDPARTPKLSRMRRFPRTFQLRPATPGERSAEPKGTAGVGRMSTHYWPSRFVRLSGTGVDRIIQCESHLERDLIMRHLSSLDLSAGFEDLEPAKMF